ncbi:hypothetical protein DERF_015052 [Dermatophagoides farinae]|uniref:Uncharacterized protein n=1 Tax=Dermatophagoides farinae TaxID=6954 RepID=A0A922HNI3_DERFA|nr:hypothetical protein DERF_015052 [Dermatophagoides farinae]
MFRTFEVSTLIDKKTYIFQIKTKQVTGNEEQNGKWKHMRKALRLSISEITLLLPLKKSCQALMLYNCKH